MDTTRLPLLWRCRSPLTATAMGAALWLFSGMAAAQSGLSFAPAVSDGLRAPARWSWSASAESPPPAPAHALLARDRLALTGWALTPGGSALGLSLGLSLPRAAGLQARGATGNGASTADIALRWQAQWDRSTRLDLAAWRRLPSGAGIASTRAALSGDADARALYGSSVELQFRSMPGLAFSPEPRVIGLRIEGGHTGLRNGGPVLYYRTRF